MRHSTDCLRGGRKRKEGKGSINWLLRGVRSSCYKPWIETYMTLNVCVRETNLLRGLPHLCSSEVLLTQGGVFSISIPFIPPCFPFWQGGDLLALCQHCPMRASWDKQQRCVGVYIPCELKAWGGPPSKTALAHTSAIRGSEDRFCSNIWIRVYSW